MEEINRQYIEKLFHERIVKEYGDETFISDGYAAHDDIIDLIMDLINKIKLERIENGRK